MNNKCDFHVAPIAQYIFGPYLSKNPGEIAEMIQQIENVIRFLEKEDARTDESGISIERGSTHRVGVTIKTIGTVRVITGNITSAGKDLMISDKDAMIRELPESIVENYRDRIKKNTLRICDVFEFLPEDKRQITHVRRAHNGNVWFEWQKDTRTEAKGWPTWRSLMGDLDES